MTITRHFFVLVPDRLPSARFSALAGWSSVAMSGSSIFSGVTIVSPVEILGLDLLLLEMLDQRLDPELAHPIGVLDDDPLELALLQGIDQRRTRIEPHEVDSLGRATIGVRDGLALPSRTSAPPMGKDQHKSPANDHSKRGRIMKSSP